MTECALEENLSAAPGPRSTVPADRAKTREFPATEFFRPGEMRIHPFARPLPAEMVRGFER